MATVKVNNVEHVYAPNPQIQENGQWAEVYPPITENCEFLRNKYTGELVPNNPDTARRSDILEPYFGDVAPQKEKPADGMEEL